MKRITKKIALFVCGIGLLIGACGKDNYDEPKSLLSGHVTYNGVPLGVRGSNESVHLQLWQDGFPVRSAINVYVSQDGSFASTLFDGTYKLVSTSNNGPWVSNQDTVVISVKGGTTADYPVTPYYTLRNISYTLAGDVLRASFDIEGVDESRAIEYVTLMVNDTQFVDVGQKENSVEVAGGSPGHVDLELNVKDNLASGKSLFARVGVKIDGVTEAIYDAKSQQLK